MPIKNRVIETIYRLKDQFSSGINKIVSGFKRVERASDQASEEIERNNRRAAGSFSKATAAIGKYAGIFASAFTATRGISAFNEFTDRIDKLGKSAAKLGTTTEELSRLGYAASLSGVEFEKLTLGLQMMARNISDAASGTGEAKDAFVALNLSASELSKLTVDEQFKRIADAFENVGNGSEKVALAMDIFGRSGADLINTMKGGSAALEEFGKTSDRVGNTISTKVSKDVQDFNDRLTELNTRVDSLGRSIGSVLVDNWNQWLKEFNVGLNPVEELDKDIDEISRKITFLKDQRGGFIRSIFGTDDIDKEIDTLKVELRDLIRQRAELFRVQEQKDKPPPGTDKVAESLRIAAETEKKIVEKKTKDLEASLKRQEAAYRKHLDIVRGLFQAETDIQKEFADLSQELLTKVQPEKTEGFSTRDVNAEIGNAYIAISEGKFDRALEISRRAGDMLRTMRTEGDHARLTLSGIAIDLQKVAEQAAKGKTDKAIVDADKEKAQVDKIKQSIEQLKAGVKADQVPIPLTLDEEKANAQMAAIRARYAQPIDLVVNVTTVGRVPTYTGENKDVAVIEDAISREVLGVGSK